MHCEKTRLMPVPEAREYFTIGLARKHSNKLYESMASGSGSHHN